MTSEQITENKGAYFGKASLKRKYVSRMKAHIAADQLIHGTYWENCKGCAIGCVVEKANDPHEQMVKELNLPLDVVYLYEKIFESLWKPHDTRFPLRVLQAIKPGADLSLIRPRFLHWLLSDERQGVLQHLPTWKKNDPSDAYTSKVVDAIKQTAAVMKNWFDTGRIDESAARSAEQKSWIAIADRFVELVSAAPTVKEVSA